MKGLKVIKRVKSAIRVGRVTKLKNESAKGIKG